MLGRAGHSVVAAASAEKALELHAAGEAFDILVADTVMLGISGTQLADRLRESRPDLPVLFTSGNAAGSFRSAAELRAGTAFIEKPYSPAELLTRVADLVAAVHRAAAVPSRRRPSPRPSRAPRTGTKGCIPGSDPLY